MSTASPTVQIIHGDCIDELRKLPESSAHSFVTDPPYGIRFMGKAWDGADINAMAARKIRRSERPREGKWGKKGGIQKHQGKAFAAGQYDLSPVGNRAFQDFSQAWGTEALRVLKPGGHLVSFASTRTYHRMVCGLEDAGFEIRDQLAWVFGSGFPKSSNQEGEWDGWGTALKPAWEPIVLARKPLIGTVPENLAAHGAGALNIAGCRIGTGDDKAPGGASNQKKDMALHGGGIINNSPTDYSVGRWPANLCHDGSPEVVAAFPAEAGAAARVMGTEPSSQTDGIFGKFNGRLKGAFHEDTGSASRFFYCAKASRSDRDAGMDDSFEKPPLNWSSGTQNPGSFQSENTDRSARNFHPTVKPTDLMRWLCRLVTPKGGTIIDPFLGSGSTGRGAVLEGFNFIGIEKDATYLPIARARIREAQGDLFADRG